MNREQLVRLETLMSTRKKAIFSRLLWEMDGEVFSTHPYRSGARPMNSREIDALVAELSADPQMRPILKHQAGVPGGHDGSNDPARA